MMRTSVWILGDQLLDWHPALDTALQGGGRAELRVVLVESSRRAARLPYQRKKLVLLFSAMRHYALLLQERGIPVEVLQADDMLSGLRQHVARWQPRRIYSLTASEYSGRVFQAQLGERLGVEVVLLGNTQFLYNPRLWRGEHACPFNFLYWNFLIKHGQVLRGNPRMGPNVLSLRHVGADEQQLIQLQAEKCLANLG